MSGKITAEKLIEDRRGIDSLLKEIENLDISGSDDIACFRNVIGMYKNWSSNLSNDNILDVARAIEGTLSSEQARQQLLMYRVDHLRRLGIFQISEEEMRRQMAERNRQRALAKRQQMEQQKLEAARLAAQQDGDEIEDDISDNDRENEDLDQNDSGIVSDSSLS